MKMIARDHPGAVGTHTTVRLNVRVSEAGKLPLYWTTNGARNSPWPLRSMPIVRSPNANLTPAAPRLSGTLMLMAIASSRLP